jgi:beta-barrel assembly-enhancing protease
MKFRGAVAVLLALALFPCPALPQESKDDKPVTDADIHSGDKVGKDIDNVDKIGSRNVGCNTGLVNWYNLDKQIALGKQFSMQVERSSKLIDDPVVTEYVNRVGQNLVRNSDAKVPFTIKVIDSDEVNAFALPGGYFYVNSGLILAADEEAQLAGVMAHEIGHVCACHAARGATRGNIMQLATIPLIFVPMGYPVYIATQEGLSLAVPLTFLKFSRGYEAQADYLGVQYMYKAGYDPNAYVTFFEKIQALEKRRPGSVAKVFSTHPPTPDRIQKSQEEIARILPEKEQYITTTSEFDMVKARLVQIENRKKPLNMGETKPTLRTKTEQGKDKKDPNSTDDDRPTLKRRPEDQ